MSEKDLNKNQETEKEEEKKEAPEVTNVQNENDNKSADPSENTDKVADKEAEVKDESADLQKKYNELKDAHIRLMAEFDNYRKRTIREKSDLISNGGKKVLSDLLPVIDDFERALQNLRTAEDLKAVTEGVELIFNKFTTYLNRQNVKPIEIVGKPFDADISEAVAMIPAPEADLKGKVLDCVQTGYMLNDKVLRHAKVVVGE